MFNHPSPEISSSSAAEAKTETPNRICAIALIYAAAIVYGSLLPFAFTPPPGERILPLYLNLRHSGDLWSATDFVTNILLFVPLGFFFVACLRSRRARYGFVLVTIGTLLICAALSACVEFAQIYFPPRDSSWRDLMANVIGAAFGIALGWGVDPSLLARGERALVAAASAPVASPHISRLVLIAAIPAFVAVCAAAGLVLSPWTGFGTAFSRIGELGGAPFRTYVAADPFQAIFSATGWFAIYAMVGFGMRYVVLRGKPPRVSNAVAVAVLLALAIEAARLFIAGKVADTGNAMIAALGAASGFLAFPLLLRHFRSAASGSPVSVASRPTAPGASLRGAPLLREAQPDRSIDAASIALRVIALLLAGGVLGIVVATYPLYPVLITAGLVIYAAVLVRWPASWLWFVPAALPIVDLAPLTGRFYFDEFDALVMVTLATGIWAIASRRQSVTGSLRAFLWLTPLAASVAISAVIGAWPLASLDANAFASYFSNYNALRVAKGFVWSFALLPLVVAATSEGIDVKHRFALGTVVGLAGVVVLAIWERVAYPGLFNPERDFRIGGFVSSMHMGGGHIETYLLLAMPFLLPLAAHTKSALARIVCAVLFVAATYALVVTFSRGAYGGYAAMVFVLLLTAACASPFVRIRWLVGVLAAMAVGLVVAAPFVTGTYAKSRFDTIAADLHTRIEHWRDAMQMMTPDTATRLFGMGLGRFPQSYLYGNREGRRPAAFRYEGGGAGTYLRLGSGDPLYVEQIVDVASGQRYQLSLRMRSNVANAQMNVLICERTYFYSYGCVSATFAGGRIGEWEQRAATIDSGRLGAGRWPVRRPVKLSLENASRGVVDVANVSLFDSAGRELVANGNFSSGSNRWFFSSSISHLSWHLKNLWLGLYFEQGALGVLAFGIVILTAGAAFSRRTLAGDTYAGAALAALAGFLCVGLFDTLIDAPRLTLMLMLTVFVARTPSVQPVHRRDRIQRGAVQTAEPMTSNAGPATSNAGPATSNAGPAASNEVAAASNAGSAIANDNDRRGVALAPTHTPVGLPALRSTAITVALIAIAIAVITRLPWVPYNLRNLPNPFHPIAAPVVLAVLAVWVLSAPGWIVVGWQRYHAMWLCFPFIVTAHGVVAWWIARTGALPAMIHKVTGSPVLGWHWEWETLARFAVLEGTLVALLAFGATIAATMRRVLPARNLGIAAIWVAAIVALGYRVIIVDAATDNLTELMNSDSAIAGFAAIGAWGVVLGYAAGVLAEWLLTRKTAIPIMLAQVLTSVIAGFALLSLGTVSSLSKYGSEFSGLQFLLSTDRTHYAGSLEIAWRYAIVHVALVVTMASVQLVAWRVAISNALPIRQHRSRDRVTADIPEDRIG